MKRTLTVINGQLAEGLLMGCQIVDTYFDGFDFRVLVSIPKGADVRVSHEQDNNAQPWRFASYETSILAIQTPSFSLMTTYRGRTLKGMIKEFRKDGVEALVHREHHAHKYQGYEAASRLLDTISTIKN